MLLQVLFHARVAAEGDGGVRHRRRRRGPGRQARRPAPARVRGGPERIDTAERQEHRWEELKRAEKQRESSVDGVALGQPAVALAAKLISRTARAGLPAELLPAAPGLGSSCSRSRRAAKLAGVDPEAALRTAARRFADDVRAAERSAREAGLDPHALDAEAWRAHWPAPSRDGRASPSRMRLRPGSVPCGVGDRPARSQLPPSSRSCVVAWPGWWWSHRDSCTRCCPSTDCATAATRAADDPAAVARGTHVHRDPAAGRRRRPRPCGPAHGAAGRPGCRRAHSTPTARPSGPRRAATPDCRVSWATLAGVGRVESDHGRLGRADLDADGVARPPSSVCHSTVGRASPRSATPTAAASTATRLRPRRRADAVPAHHLGALRRRR